MKMEQSNCLNDLIAQIIAEDMLNLSLNAEFEVSQFPVPATILFDVLNTDTFISILDTLKKHIYWHNIPLGFTILFLMPRNIPLENEAKFFKEVLYYLHNIRKDFSLRSSIELKKLTHNLPSDWEEISINEYRKFIFLLENLTELKVPIFRGWAYDIFIWNGYLYRAYNLGTLKDPRWFYFKIKIIQNPVLDVFDHVIEPEIPEKVWIYPNMNIGELMTLLEESINNAKKYSVDMKSRIYYTVKQWEIFLDLKVERIVIKNMISKDTYKKEISDEIKQKLVEGTKKYLLYMLN